MKFELRVVSYPVTHHRERPHLARPHRFLLRPPPKRRRRRTRAPRRFCGRLLGDVAERLFYLAVVTADLGAASLAFQKHSAAVLAFEVEAPDASLDDTNAVARQVLERSQRDPRAFGVRTTPASMTRRWRRKFRGTRTPRRRFRTARTLRQIQQKKKRILPIC